MMQHFFYSPEGTQSLVERVAIASLEHRYRVPGKRINPTCVFIRDNIIPHRRHLQPESRVELLAKYPLRQCPDRLTED